MSHASVMIAVTPERLKEFGDVETAIAWEMEPFDENGTCFRDGSRWDWYQVGGRYTGKFLGADTILVKRLDLNALAIQRKDSFVECYREAQASPHKDSIELIFGVKPEETLEQFLERNVDGVILSSYAFLSDRHWHEAERLGWFGGSTYTECELKAKAEGRDGIEEMIQKCLHKDEGSGARVICWNEPSELWSQHFYHRFVEPLHPDTMLVNVDYHV